MYYRIIFYMCEYCKSLPKANLGLCYRGFQIFFFRPAADLPTQPPVRHSIAGTPLLLSLFLKKQAFYSRRQRISGLVSRPDQRITIHSSIAKFLYGDVLELYTTLVWSGSTTTPQKVCECMTQSAFVSEVIFAVMAILIVKLLQLNHHHSPDYGTTPRNEYYAD